MSRKTKRLQQQRISGVNMIRPFNSIPSRSITVGLVLLLSLDVSAACADGPTLRGTSAGTPASRSIAAMPAPSQAPAQNSKPGADGAVEPAAPPPVPDVIELPKPELQALITIDEQMNPYELEASASKTITLRQSLITAVEQNLDIGISHTQVAQQKWTYLGSLGK